MTQHKEYKMCVKKKSNLPAFFIFSLPFASERRTTRADNQHTRSKSSYHDQSSSAD